MRNSVKAQAMVSREAGSPFEPAEVELDGPRDDEILVRLVAAGICQTDLHVHSGHVPYPRPCVLGHEGAGIVVEVGKAVPDLSPGDRVVLTFASCGKCRNCSVGHPAYCAEFRQLNFSGLRPDGSATMRSAAGPVHGSFFSQSSFSNLAIARGANAVRLPEDAPLDILAPLGCGIQTGAGAVLNVLRPEPGSSIGIIGAGAVGLSALLAARLAGCRTILAVDRLPDRLELAAWLGATRTLRLDNARDLHGIGELGLHYIVDTTGSPAIIEAAIRHLEARGKCALIGAPQPPGEIVLDLGLMGRRSIVGVIEGDSDPRTFLPFLAEKYCAGQFPIDRMITFYPSTDINRAAQDLRDGRTVKPVLRFDPL